MLYRASLPLLIALAACGGGSGSDPVDAAGQADAGPPSVRVVGCPPGVVPTVTTSDSMEVYMPSSASISVGGIVKFMTSSMHDVSPNSMRMTDAGLVVGFNKTVCLEFDKAGTFGFKCSVHGFMGTITVQ
jgi:plastocyanin